MLKKVILPFLIIALAISLSVVMIKNRPQAEQSDTVPITTLVEVMPVHYEDAAIQVASQGTVEARTSSTLVSEVSGQVIDVAADFVAGGFFREGDLLLQIDDRNYKAAVSRAEAGVATARSLLEQERGQADVARREWDRMTETQQSQVRARELYLRQPQLQEAEAQLAAAEADLAQARSDLAKTRIVAPYDGLISSKQTDIGQYINTGTSVAEIFAVDYAEVRLPIPENKIQFLDLPDAVGAADNPASHQPEVMLSSSIGDRKFHWQGRLTRTEGVLDTRTRVLFSVVQVEDPYGLYSKQHEEPLRIGTYVSANIKGERLQDVVVLPRHTLQANDIVWVSDQEKRLRPRNVDVVTVNGDNAFIVGGFEAGDMIITTRMENPLNGMLVETQEVPAPGQLIQ